MIMLWIIWDKFNFFRRISVFLWHKKTLIRRKHFIFYSYIYIITELIHINKIELNMYRVYIIEEKRKSVFIPILGADWLTTSNICMCSLIINRSNYTHCACMNIIYYYSATLWIRVNNISGVFMLWSQIIIALCLTHDMNIYYSF